MFGIQLMLLAKTSWICAKQSEGIKRRWGYFEMCPHFLYLCPQMYPQTASDCGTLQRTLTHYRLRSTEGKKKKAGSWWKLTTLSVVPSAGIEPASDP